MKAQRPLSEQMSILQKFRGVLLRCGNKERSLVFFTHLIRNMKHIKAGRTNLGQYPTYTRKNSTPIGIIQKGLYKLKPAFLLKPVIVAGKRYQLPIPISPNRARFMAINWLRKAAEKNNKNPLSVIDNMTREISNSFYRRGSAQQFLKAHIDIALDQRPFSRFIRKRRKYISKSRNTRANKKLVLRYRKKRRKKRLLRYRSFFIRNKIRTHKTRKKLIISKFHRTTRKKLAVKQPKFPKREHHFKRYKHR